MYINDLICSHLGCHFSPWQVNSIHSSSSLTLFSHCSQGYLLKQFPQDPLLPGSSPFSWRSPVEQCEGQGCLDKDAWKAHSISIWKWKSTASLIRMEGRYPPFKIRDISGMCSSPSNLTQLPHLVNMCTRGDSLEVRSTSVHLV